MKLRPIDITVDAINAIFADYAALADYPTDAKPVTLLLNPQEKKFRLRIEAESLPASEHGKVEAINFHLRRVWGGN